LRITGKVNNGGLTQKRLLGIGEVAERLGVSKNTLYDWCAFGKIPYLKIGKFLRFDPQEIDHWLQGKKIGVPK